MIIPRGFKYFSSTLIKIRIQTRSSPGHFKKFASQSWKLKSTWGLKYSKIYPSQPRISENFGGGSIGYLKITEDKASDASFTNVDLISYTRGSHFNSIASLWAPHFNSNIILSALHFNSNASASLWAPHFNLKASLWASRFNADISMWAPRLKQ